MNKMPKSIFIMFSLILTLLLLCSCGGDGGGPVAKTDRDKIENTLTDMNTLLDLETESEGSTDGLLDEIKKISFSLEDLTVDGEATGGYAVLSNSALYISPDGREATQLIKLFRDGMLFISEDETGVTSSITPFSSEMQSDVESVDIKLLLTEMIPDEDDLVSTQDEGYYKLSREYIKRVAALLLGGEDAEATGIDLATVTASVDLRDYRKDGKITFTAGPRTDSDLLTLVLSTTRTKDALSGSITADIRADGSELSIGLEIKKPSDGAFELKLELSAGGEGDDRIELDLAVSGAPDGGGSIAFDLDANGAKIEFSCGVSHTGSEGGKESYQLDAEGSIYYSGYEYELDAEAALSEKDGELLSLTAEITLVENKSEELTLTLSYDGSAKDIQGATTIISGSLVGALEEMDPTNISFSVKTVSVSDGEKKYTLTVTNEDNPNEKITGTVYSPARIEPKMSKKANLCLRHGTNILFDYQKYLEKANEINEEITAILASGDLSGVKTAYVTYSTARGIYYITEVTAANGGYVARTYSSPDAFMIGYLYPQNRGDFRKPSNSQAYNDAQGMAYVINDDKPPVNGGLTGDFYTYTYIDEYDLYLLMKNDSVSSATVLYERPSEESLGVKLHELVYDEYGRGKIHSFETYIGEDCYLYAKCTHCGVTAKDSRKRTHDFITDISHSEGGNVEWQFTDCARCGECTLELYNTGIKSVTVTLRRLNSDDLSRIRKMPGFEEYAVSTDKCTLVIDGIHYTDSGVSDSLTVIIDIPSLSDSTDYRIVGVRNGLTNSHSSTACELVLPPESEFILDSAFSGIHPLTKVTAPGAVFIGNSAFMNCSGLSEALISGSARYIGDNAFCDCKKLNRIRNGEDDDCANGVFNLPDSVQFIGASAFSGTSVRSVTLHSGITEIPSHMFSYCKKLESVAIEGEVVSVGYRAFYNCAKLSDIVLPSSVTTIGEYAFYICALIDDSAISSCTALTSIGGYAFAYCAELKNVVVPESVTALGNAFCYCELDSLRFECVFNFSTLFSNMTVKNITYANRIEKNVVFGQVTNILTAELPKEPNIRHQIRGTRTVNFAGSEEEFIAAGYLYDASVTVNFNVIFEE